MNGLDPKAHLSYSGSMVIPVFLITQVTRVTGIVLQDAIQSQNTSYHDRDADTPAFLKIRKMDPNTAGK